MNLCSLELSVLVSVAVIVVVNASPIEYYATKYEHIDLEEILNNRRMVKYYANCLLYKGPCTPQGLELRKILPEALETNCLRCTEKQKVVTYQSIKRLKKEYPKTWALLETQWDPKNIYVKRFEESVKQNPSSVAPENEIIIEDRFGDPDVSTKPSTTKPTKLKKTKPISTITTTTTTTTTTSTTPKTIKSSRIPSINNIASASEKKPSSLPQSNQLTGSQAVGVNVANQVGTPNQEDSGNKSQRSSTLGIPKISTTPRIPPSFIPPSSPSPKISQTQSSVPDVPARVTFDIPQSSMNHPQTKKLLQSAVQTTTKPSKPKTPTAVKNKQQTTRQFDPISHLVSSFLSANRPPTSRPRPLSTSTTQSPTENPNLQIRLPKISGHVRKAGVRNRARLEANTTAQIGLRSAIQFRLPGLTVKNQVEGFHPVGNFVRGLANAGDRLIETGTSIADSVLTSVNRLFPSRARRNRALRRS